MTNMKTISSEILIEIFNTPIKMILKYFISVLTNLKQIHVGTMLIKFKASITLGILVSPFAMIFEKLSHWGLENSDYILVVMTAIGIDHFLGTIKHLKDGDFTWKKNVIGVTVKLGLIVLMGFLFEGLQVIVQSDSIVKEYMIIVTRLIVFLYPAGSAFGNSAILTNGKFPPQAWIDKLTRFQRDLDPKDLTKKQQANETNI